MESDPMKILETYVRKTWDGGNHLEQWRNLPEIPNKAEIMPKKDEDADPQKNDENWDDYQKDPIYHPDLPKNIIKGPWPSKEEYISAHYQILREDAIAPLRASIKYFKKHRNMDDDKDTCIYTHVSIQILCSNCF
jgi:helicase required for RNAi-mediated heterochromatin assembly 1